jgi:hypothetical protein
MADFTPKKVSGESGPGIRPKAEGSRDVEHEDPPVLHLQAHHIGKLFSDGKMPKVGSKIKVSGLVHVGATSEHQEAPPSGGKAKGGEGNTRRTMALHFHKMEVGIDQQSSDAKEQGQKDGMKAAIDKALTKDAGSSAEKGKAKGTTPTPRGGGD